MKNHFISIFLISFCTCYGWDGYNWESGENIEIEKGNLVRSGLDIEVYNWNSGEYNNEEVISISSDEIETYDNETGEYHTYDMD